MRTKDGFCARCQHEKKIQARGLCGACYQWVIVHGLLEEYPRVLWVAEDRAEDYEFLFEQEGMTVAQAAERMGITEATLHRALKKAGAPAWKARTAKGTT